MPACRHAALDFSRLGMEFGTTCCCQVLLIVEVVFSILFVQLVTSYVALEQELRCITCVRHLSALPKMCRTRCFSAFHEKSLIHLFLQNLVHGDSFGVWTLACNIMVLHE